jgi:hypothetical protein
MSLLTSKSGNIVGASLQGGYFNNLTVDNTLTVNGPTDVEGGAVSTVAPGASLPSLYLNVNVDGVAYKAPAYQSTPITVLGCNNPNCTCPPPCPCGPSCGCCM